MNAAVGVIGAGAWGTALAVMLAGDGSGVLLWTRSPGLAAQINRQRGNESYLPGVALASPIVATSDIADLADVPVVLAVAPAQHLSGVLASLPDRPRDLVLCAKGIEAGSGRLMADVARQAAPAAALAVLSGPTFAHEVARGLPTAVTLACEGGEPQWRRLSRAIGRPAFRPYYSDDVVGAQIGGAVKNVLAIACGVVDGLDLGENARASLIARGFAEMLRFGQALGARAQTLSGLCGLGDLVLTCASAQSRNYALGRALGQGRDVAQALDGRLGVAEGAHTAPVLAGLARQRGIAMPIAAAVARLLAGGQNARETVADLLSRPLTAESASGREATAPA